MRAAIYLRVSTDRQDQKNQQPDCERLCAARGFTHARLYEERESGAKEDREKWAEVLEDARRGQIRAVVVWSLDRVGRSMWQVIRDIQELTRLGCQVVSVKESWLDTGGPTRDLLLAIFAWVAQQERERLRERTRAGLERARRAGKVLGRPRTLPVEAVATAAQLKAQGLSWSQVAKAVAQAGHGQHGRTVISKAVTRLKAAA